MLGTTPLDLASGLLSREHRHLAPATPTPMLAMLAQHCRDGATLAFLAAAMHGTIWKMSQPAASDVETAISDATSSTIKHTAAAAVAWSFIMAQVGGDDERRRVVELGEQTGAVRAERTGCRMTKPRDGFIPLASCSLTVMM